MRRLLVLTMARVWVDLYGRPSCYNRHDGRRCLAMRRLLALALANCAGQWHTIHTYFTRCSAISIAFSGPRALFKVS